MGAIRKELNGTHNLRIFTALIIDFILKKKYNINIIHYAGRISFVILNWYGKYL